MDTAYWRKRAERAEAQAKALRAALEGLLEGIGDADEQDEQGGCVAGHNGRCQANYIWDKPHSQDCPLNRARAALAAQDAGTGTRCPECGGRGWNYGVGPVDRTCPACHGSGYQEAPGTGPKET